MTQTFGGLLGIGRYFIWGELRQRGYAPRERRFVVERHGDLVALYYADTAPGQKAFVLAIDPERVELRQGSEYIIKKQGYSIHLPLPTLQAAVRTV